MFINIDRYYKNLFVWTMSCLMASGNFQGVLAFGLKTGEFTTEFTEIAEKGVGEKGGAEW
jgi:hypothetical protein